MQTTHCKQWNQLPAIQRNFSTDRLGGIYWCLINAVCVVIFNDVEIEKKFQRRAVSSRS